MSFFDKMVSSRQNIVQNLAAVGSASAVSTAVFNGQTYQVRLCTDVGIWFLIANAAVVTSANGSFLPANFPDYFTVTPGQKVSTIVVSGTTAANVSITEMA